MEIQFLGTSSGTPTKARNVSGLALRASSGRQWHLIDCGEATQHRILHTTHTLASLQAIFITHIHGDHCYGLPGLLASAGMSNRSAPLRIMGPQAVERFVRGVMESTQLELPFPLEFIDVASQPVLRLDDADIEATLLSHRVPSYAYTFTERRIEARLDGARLRAAGVPSGPEWGRLQQGEDVLAADGRLLRAADYRLEARKPRRIVIGGDNDTPALLDAQMREADAVVHEATYTDDVLNKVGPAPQHSSARMIAHAAQAAGVRNLVLTHFSSRYQSAGPGPSVADVEAEARAHYGGRLFLARDLERYALDKQGVLSRVET